MDHASLFAETVYCYLPKLCTLICRNCAFLFANFSVLLFADHTVTMQKVFFSESTYFPAEKKPDKTMQQTPLCPWSEQRAWQWYEQHPWMVGCNYLPATAINQLEMWQSESFDPFTIDKELSWA